MKRLPAAPPTEEDIAVVHFRCFAAHCIPLQRAADGRDADLMLTITSGEDVGAFHWIRRGPNWRNWLIAPDHPVTSGQKFT